MRVDKLRLFWIIVLAFIILEAVAATDVLAPGNNPPQRVVQVRKLAMRANAGSLISLMTRIKAGQISQVASDAVSIASLATFIPVVFIEPYRDVYPQMGSKYYFKGGSTQDVQAATAKLNTAAEDLMRLTGEGGGQAGVAAASASDVQAQANQVQAACGSCHTAFRGQL